MCADLNLVPRRGKTCKVDRLRPGVRATRVAPNESVDPCENFSSLPAVAGLQPTRSLMISPLTSHFTELREKFDQGGLGLGSGSRSYYMDIKKYAKQVSAYLKYMKLKVKLITEDAGLVPNEEQISKDIDEMF
ncbi:unnamed protein product, partial [Mesorhabditis belari]|uniref:Uncharacterized protein n=1 Tax=Mesorhabditis belari TaxID=2138241 RepID=A0AAF3ESB9_9BILA